jgi:hypothetical protein
VLLEQLARLLAGAVGLADRVADAFAPLVDHRLHRSERVALQDEHDDREADDRPDHEAGDDLDECVCPDEHQTSTNPSRPPIRP